MADSPTNNPTDPKANAGPSGIERTSLPAPPPLLPTDQPAPLPANFDKVQLGRIVHYVEGPTLLDDDPCRAAIVTANWDKRGDLRGLADLLVFDPTGVVPVLGVTRHDDGGDRTWHWPGECRCCGAEA